MLLYLSAMNESDFKELIRDIPNFPKEGVIFKDISPLLASAKARKELIDQIALNYSEQQIDVVVGIEARGFVLGPIIAQALDASFVMCRKPGKLPGLLISEPYQLEYGVDRIEMQRDAIAPGSTVLVHDDVLATGGTAAAAVRLIEKAAGQVLGLNFIIELDFLKGREQVGDYPIYSTVRYS